jgi:transcriptional regulator with XRE-family HTH domain
VAEEGVPTPSLFGAALRQGRLRAGLSQNALAHRASIDPAYVNRMEAAAERAPVIPRRPVVESLARALELGRLETDRLLLAAGLAPARLLEPGVWDAALSLAAEVLADPRLSGDDRAEFRQVLRLLAGRWRAGGGAAG